MNLILYQTLYIQVFLINLNVSQKKFRLLDCDFCKRFFSKEIKGTKAIKLISINLQVIRNLFIEIPKIEEINKIKIKDLFLNHEMYLELN